MRTCSRPGAHLPYAIPPVLLVAGLALIPVAVQAQEETRSMTNMTDAAAEASALRHDIHHRFEQLKAAGTLSASVRGNDIRGVVQKYVSAGTGLDRAEELLRQAGFEIEARQPIPAGEKGTARTIRASSRTIVKSTAFGTSDEVVVELGTDGAAADPKVGAVAAHIYITSL